MKATIAALMILVWTNAAIVFASDLKADRTPIWVDVRTGPEYVSGHIPGAHHISFERIGDGIGQITTDKNAPLRLYCQSGRRSGFAKQTLEKLGYTNVVNAGGINNVIQNTQLQPATGPERVAHPVSQRYPAGR